MTEWILVFILVFGENTGGGMISRVYDSEAACESAKADFTEAVAEAGMEASVSAVCSERPKL